MQEQNLLEIKRFISRAILLGLIVSAVLFAYVLFLPKKYQISGNMVIFPAGSEAAQKNLGLEAGNTVKIINSAAFKKNNFPGEANNFLRAQQAKNSSTIEIIFVSELSQRTAIENMLANTPQAVSDYARDLYGGSPFKYKLISDPEISSGPVEPNLYLYIGGGFIMGFILFFFYWLFFEFLRVSIEGKAFERENVEQPIIPSVDFHGEEQTGETKAMTQEEPVEPVYEYEMPVRESEADLSQQASGKVESAAPDNLPILEMVPKQQPEILEEIAPPPASEYHEPTDDEVKERLNKLMRGEL